MGAKGIILAVEAGICAAMASVSAKLAVSSSSARELAALVCYSVKNIFEHQVEVLSLYEVMLTVRLISVLGIFVFNALMWVLFTKSMHQCSSTLEATTFNLSSNFISTAIVGNLLFGENLNSVWFVGSLFIIVGLTIVHRSSDDITSTKSQQCIEKEERDKTKTL
uniref:EamA domain-containing protein n=1 Tax=Biomphalaria glabrata TaxID=6526 RepID=A0A2C9LRG1_BIOGL